MPPLLKNTFAPKSTFGCPAPGVTGDLLPVGWVAMLFAGSMARRRARSVRALALGPPPLLIRFHYGDTPAKQPVGFLGAAIGLGLVGHELLKEGQPGLPHCFNGPINTGNVLQVLGVSLHPFRGLPDPDQFVTDLLLRHH